MSLPSGSRLGPYRVLKPLGAGGMGEVYLAHDDRLGRQVAVKVLPAHVALSPERRRRLEREARALARLSHPHVAALYDVGFDDGRDYLVMEYVEGETLRDRLARGALPAAEVLRLGRELADALASAHRFGIVHRDLKPGNVMLTSGGAKLLDFGLARPETTATAEGQPGLSAVPTAGEPLTAEGAIVGTLQYMSPEQLEGRCDARSDIFQLGAVLYEAATGSPAFQGKSQASLIAAILERDPPAIADLVPLAPPELSRVVASCLAKDPGERWQSAHDLKLRLAAIAGGLRDDDPQATSPPPVRRRALAAGLAALLVLAMLATGFALGRLRRSAPALPRPAVRFTLGAGPDESVGPPVAVSPDGSRFVYAVTRRGEMRLVQRRRGEREAAPIAGSEQARTPGHRGVFFSPDGEWLGFFHDGQLRKVSLRTGLALTLCEYRGDDNGGSWGEDGFIYFVPNWGAGIWRVADGGGKAELVAEPDPARQERAYAWPEVLPGGRALLFTVWTGSSPDQTRVIAMALPGGRRTFLVNGTRARYSPSGHLLYAREGSLLAVPFDARRLEVLGPPQLVAEGVAMDPTMGLSHFAVAGGGTLLYAAGSHGFPERRVVLADDRGTVTPLLDARGPYSNPRLSPDGTRLALTVDTLTFDVWLVDLGRGTLARLTTGGNDYLPVWTPDGSRVIYTSDRADEPGRASLWWTAADGSGSPEPLSRSGREQFAGSVSPDGKWLAYEQAGEAGADDADIWLLPLAGERTPSPWLRSRFREGWPMFSPDGRWLAYASDESGRREVYAQPFPGPGAKVQVSTEGGMEPRWAQDGSRIFYRHGNQFLAVALETTPQLKAALPRLFCEGDYFLAYQNSYDVAADGRLILLEQPPAGEPERLEVVLGWPQVLRGK